MNDKSTALQKIKYLVLIPVALALSTLPAKAWNNVGHRAIAELTWRQMDKAERQSVSELLKHHPHYKQLLVDKVPEGADTNEWAFLMASIWPDWVRPAKNDQPKKSDSITKYDLYPHAIGYPFLGAGDTNRALLKNFYIAKPNAEMVLSNSIATLNNPKASTHDRAVSLCWTLHLYGDLHQPLHTANLVTKKRPGGDHLGGYHIALDERGNQINFHSFWDQLGGVTPTYQTIVALANKLETDPRLKPASLKEYQQNKTIASWVQEGFQIATNFAYSEKHVHFAHEDDLKSGKISSTAIPTLPAEYVTQAREIAHRRLVLAAQRLTDVLKKTF